MRWKIRVAMGLAFLAIASLSFADDRKPAGWQFEIMPYAWIPSPLSIHHLPISSGKLLISPTINEALPEGRAKPDGDYQKW